MSPGSKFGWAQPGVAEGGPAPPTTRCPPPSIHLSSQSEASHGPNLTPTAKGFLGHLGLELKPWGRAPAASAKGREGGSVVGRGVWRQHSICYRIVDPEAPSGGAGKDRSPRPPPPCPQRPISSRRSLTQEHPSLLRSVGWGAGREEHPRPKQTLIFGEGLWALDGLATQVGVKSEP